MNLQVTFVRALYRHISNSSFKIPKSTGVYGRRISGGSLWKQEAVVTRLTRLSGPRR